MDKEKTAMQSILDIVEMDNRNHVEISMSVFIGMLKKGLELEKQQMIDMHKDGQRFILNDYDEKIIEHASIEYFNAKYGIK